MELGRWMGYLHPVLIHFPIVLLMVAVALEAAEFFRSDARVAFAARLLLLLGVVSTLIAFVCGNFAEIWAARSGISQNALEYHEFLATITSWLFVGLTGWRLLMKESRVQRGVWLVAAIGACVLLGFTGHHGAKLVYEHGAAVREIGLRQIPSHDDLLTLTQRQDSESIFYSNMMHHIFGWLVLILSGLLLLDLIAPRVAERARRIGPPLLLVGGIFLLVYSDQDAWPLYHVRPFRPIIDKEVLLHKTYAALMILVGLRGIWSMLRKREQAAGWRVQSRLMAVFALVGGALLFTHIHSAAPYANVAVGVYIHHTVMGFVALCIGAVKLLDDVALTPGLSSNSGRGRRIRWRAVAYPALMCLESIFLINYNEGLPWFLGYGNLAMKAPHGGLIAPFGPHRAELVYNRDTGRLEVYALRRDFDESIPLRLASVNAIVRLGDEATQLTMPGNPGVGGTNDHFAARASFLQAAPLFQVRVTGEIDGRQATADFEPVIDRKLLPANQAFICPMHSTEGGETTGVCRICGMPLQMNGVRRTALHDPQFALDLDQVAPTAGQSVKLVFTPRHNGTVIDRLATVHTKKLHLIIVRRDLGFFDHIHPNPQPGGKLSIDYAFPTGGEYVLFADLTPAGGANQLFRIPLQVAGESPPAVPLIAGEASGKAIGDYRVAIQAPEPLAANEESVLTFTVQKEGRPVTDLQPYLGAAGHCVILSEDSQTYIHSHPVETSGGPSVSFHARFPKQGLFKAWVQFKHLDRVVTADFVLQVQ